MAELVSIDDRELKRLIKTLKRVPGAIERVVPRGVNRTADKANTEIKAEINAQTGIKKGIIGKAIKRHRANRNRWLASIDADESSRIPLIDFGMTKRVNKNQRGGQKYTMQNESRHIPYNKNTSPVFKSKLPSGRMGVFRRVAEISAKTKRPKIIQLFGPSLSQVMGGDASYKGVIEKASQNAATNLEKNITKQIGLEMERQLAKK